MSIEETVRRALAEDVGSGDITTDLCVPADACAVGSFIAREPMVVAGVEVLQFLFNNPEIKAPRGARVNAGTEIACVRDSARRLLTAERVALNFLQRLCGVATLARQYADAVAHTKCRVLDTRKTTPGLRKLEKSAAAAGGVCNHRMGLYDAVLIKNNHITAAGGVRAALERVKNAKVPIAIEVRTVEELDEALECGAPGLLLDNLTPDEATVWIRRINGRAVVELSGGITLETVRAYAETGADYVSCGAITHSAQAVDINFRLRLE